MFIVITGLDGSGTSTIATKLHNLDKGSILLHTPSTEYDSREMIDTSVYKTSIDGNCSLWLIRLFRCLFQPSIRLLE